MEIGISGSETIPGSPAEIWQCIRDPARLAKSLSDFELRRVDAERFDIAFRVKVGLLRSLFRGVLEFHELLEPESCRVRIDARGRAGGIAGWTRVRLLPVETGEVTQVHFESLLTVSGFLKAAGSELTKRIGKSLAESLLRGVGSGSSRGGG